MCVLLEKKKNPKKQYNTIIQPEFPGVPMQNCYGNTLEESTIENMCNLLITKVPKHQIVLSILIQ